jgi:hypothetical protein
MSITLKSVEALGGAKIPSEIVVKQITSGSYWPVWRDTAPLREVPAVGSQYCVMLREIDGGYAIAGGVNGIYEVRDGQLYFGGRTPVNITTRQLRRMRERHE